MSFQKQIGQSLLWRGLYFVTVLVMNVFISRYFQAGDAGWIFYLCNNFSLIVILAGLTMETSVNYYSAKQSIDDDRLAWFSLIWTVGVSIIVFTGLWFYFGRYKNTTVITRSAYLFYAICYISGIQLTNFFSSLFYANKNFFLPNFLMVIINLIVIIFIPKQEGTENTNTVLIINLYFAFFMITGLTLAAAFIIKKGSWKNISLPVFKDMRLLVKYAVIALAANVIFFLVYRVDYWFVKKYCSPEALGNYIQVSKLGQMLLIIPSIISSVVFPHTAGGSILLSDMKDNIMRIGRITTLLFVMLILVIAASGMWLFPFVFGPTFQLMYYPFLLILPGIWALSNLYILSAYFGGINRVKVNVKGAGLGLLVILAGDYFFIPRYGILAASLISSIGYFVNFIYSFMLFKKEHPVSFTEYWTINIKDLQWLKSIIPK